MEMTTRDTVLAEIDNVRRDLDAFKRSFDALQQRFVELESDKERYNRLVDWSVTQIIMNGLHLAIVKCEGLIEDYQKYLDAREPAPVISLVKGDYDGDR